MKRQSEFWEIFLGGPSSELIGAFALGLLVVGIGSNLVYDLLLAPSLDGRAAVGPLLAMAACTGAAYLLYRRAREGRPPVDVVVDESRLAPPHAGLVWLLGPGPFDHLLAALRHHREGGGAGDCWLVMDESKAVQQAFGRLVDAVADWTPPVDLHPVYLRELDARSAYAAVRDVMTREADEAGLASGEVIADITGGLKPMTAGMVLAALATDAPLEYVESERDEKGRYIEDSQRVVLLDLGLAASREARGPKGAAGGEGAASDAE
jgi:hypothetical protein